MDDEKTEEKSFEEKRKEEDSMVKRENLTEKMRGNPWIISTLVLGVLALILLVGNFSGTGNFITGSVISEEDAGQTVIDFVQAQTNGEGELVEVSDFNDNFYEVIIMYQGNKIPLYLTKDGEYFTSSLIPLAEIGEEAPEQTAQSTEVPKSDKPVVELFIWSYCPYGVQAQGPLAEVAFLLGDSADFESVLYYGGHGDYEIQQNKIQACIQEIAPDKYWDYAAGFVEDIYPVVSQSRDIEADKTESIKLMKSLGIDDSAVMSCVDSKGEDLIAEHAARAKEYGVTGSPTLIVNGVKVNVARTADAFKGAVCDAFNNAPEECSTTLDSSATTTSGNC